MSNGYNFDLSFLDSDTKKQEGLGAYDAAFGSVFKLLWDKDKVPNFIKEGYNRSIEGLAYKAMSGKNFYNTGSYTPGHLADIGATIVSFIGTPTDLASMVVGGALGKAALKPLMGKAARLMHKSGGVPKRMAEKAIEAGTIEVGKKGSALMLTDEFAKVGKGLKQGGLPGIAEKYAERLAGATGGLGFYSGLQSAALQKVETGDIDAVKAVYEGTKGGLTAFAGATAAAGLTPAITKKLGIKGLLAQQMAAKGVEAGAFGTSPAVFETLEGNPRLPHVSDYTHAIGVIGALSAPKFARQLSKQRKLKALTPKDTEDFGTEVAEMQYRVESDVAKGKPISYRPSSRVQESFQTERDLRKEKKELWETPEQEITSAETSINKQKVAGGFTTLTKENAFKEGHVNLDIGGGSFDNANTLLNRSKAKNLVYDPFNRSSEHNRKVVDQVSGGKSDSVTLFNVLNVIKEKANINKVLKQAENAVKEDGAVYISVYDKSGKGTGKGEATGKGWQRNQKLKDYLPMVKEIFPNATVEKGLIRATKSKSKAKYEFTEPTSQFNEVLYNNKNKIVMLDRNWRDKKGDQKMNIEVLESKEGGLAVGKQQILVSEFNKNVKKTIKGSYDVNLQKDFVYKDGVLVDKAAENIYNKERSTARKISKELGISKEEFAAKENEISKSNKINIRSGQELHYHYGNLKAIRDFLAKEAKTDAFKHTVAYYKYPSPLKKYIPKIYDTLIEPLKPGEKRVYHPVKTLVFDSFKKFDTLFQNRRNAYLSPWVYKNTFGKEVGFGVAKRAGLFDMTDAEASIAYKVMTSEVVGVKDGKVYQGGAGLGKNVEFRTPEGEVFKFKNFDPNKLRASFDEIYAEHKKMGINVRKREPNYLPNIYTPETLNLLTANVFKIAKALEYSPHDLKKLTSAISKDGKQSREVEQFIQQYLDQAGVDPKFREYMNILKNKFTEENIQDQKPNLPLTAAYGKLAGLVYSQRLSKENPFLEKGRKFNPPEGLKELPGFMETDVRNLSKIYFNRAAERLAAAESFGVTEQRLRGYVNGLAAIGKTKDAEMLIRMGKAATGRIEYDPQYNWSPKVKSTWEDITNFQVASKIGLGFAVIPNITQTFISTALKTGYGPIMKGWYKYRTDPEYRKLVASVSFDFRDIFQHTFGYDISSQRFMGKFAQATTERFLGIPGMQFLSFNKINEINFKTSAIASVEYLKKQQKIVNGQGMGGKLGRVYKSRAEKAKRDLEAAGFTEKTNLNFEKITPENYSKLQEYAFQFSKDYQLQRSVLKDPIFASDPRWRPFFLFKRFGYRQFTLLQRVLNEEAKSNPEIILRLAAAGLAGAAFVMPAKDMLSTFLAGESIYDENYSSQHILPYLAKGQIAEATKEVRFSDITDAMAAVGVMGTIGDMVASENGLRGLLDAVKFAALPVVFSDVETGYKASQRLLSDLKDFGIGGAILRAPKNLAGVMGSAPRRLLKRFETPSQREGYITARRRRVKGQVLDSLISGDHQQASRLIIQWNRSYGYEDPILYDDVGPEEINRRVLLKYQKSLPVQYLGRAPGIT